MVRPASNLQTLQGPDYCSIPLPEGAPPPPSTLGTTPWYPRDHPLVLWGPPPSTLRTTGLPDRHLPP